MIVGGFAETTYNLESANQGNKIAMSKGKFVGIYALFFQDKTAEAPEKICLYVGSSFTVIQRIEKHKARLER